MARKQKKKSDEVELSDGLSVAQMVTLATSLLLFIALLITLVVGRDAMRTRASNRASNIVQVQFTWPPLAGTPQDDSQPHTWLDASSRASLEQLALSILSPDPFDRPTSRLRRGPDDERSSLEATSDALMDTGWFKEIKRLRRYPDGRVSIEGEWRIPAAVVRTGGRDHLVAATGEKLPLNYAHGASGLKVIVGMPGRSPQRGERWMGGEVEAAIDLLHFLRNAPGYDQVMGVDVADFRDNRRLTIVTDKATRLLWGGPVYDSAGRLLSPPGQADPESKRSSMVRLYRQSGRIDHQCTFVDLSLLSGPEIDRTANNQSP